MKKIEAIIRQETLDDLKDAMQNAFEENPIGMTVTQVLGFGHQKGLKDYVRGQEVITSFVPKIKVGFVLKDKCVEQMIDLIVKTCQTGNVGDGKIFVYPVEEAIRIRTGERGESAI